MLIGLFFYVGKLNQPETEEETISEKVVERVAKTVDKKQLECLATNIYYEAGKESTEGKAAVARVVLNRVNYGFAENPCKVVYQVIKVKQVTEDDEPLLVKVCQFSWVCEDRPHLNKNSERYRSSQQVAYDVLAYDAYKDIIPKTVLFFHNTTVKPQWRYKEVKKIGNHVFYRK
jgi:spore germination cell wall hydrolase CwlJ-like protein